ncbi:MAG TPA: TetR/AcrR family transcriptional regulator [Thermoleophilaceae bacterium]|nr:TetR/AcrR family transcriptional regulator [Thermoleophilaceae bacterium]
MATKSPRMTGADRRQQLLDVTKAIVAADGFHAVSIERVAREAGITRPVVYGHFGDLEGLLEALIDRETLRSISQLEDVLRYDLAEGDQVETLLASLRGYLEAVRADPDTWRLVLMPQEGAPPSLHERIAAGRAAVVAQLARNTAAGFRPGDESPDPELTAHMLSAVSDEGARLLLTDPDRYSLDRILTHARWLLERLQ